jgi:hypothetical protein
MEEEMVAMVDQSGVEGYLDGDGEFVEVPAEWLGPREGATPRRRDLDLLVNMQAETWGDLGS